MQPIISMSIGLNLLLIFFTIRVLKNNFANLFLLSLLSIVLLGTSYVISLNYFTYHFTILPHFINSLPALIGSFTYLYVFYSINSLKKFHRVSIIHLLPFLVAFPLCYFENEDITFTSIVLNIGVKIIVSLVYFVISLKLLKKYKTAINNHFSKTEMIDLKWLEFVVKIGFISYIIYFIIMILWYIDVDALSNIDSYANTIVIIFIFSISYYSISSTKVFERISNLNSVETLQDEAKIETINQFVNKNEKKELINTEEAELILKKIISIIETKKLFENENLMLEDLAKELDLHSKYVSYVINNIAGKNFFDFINHFRIMEFNKEVLNPKNKNLTFLTIAYNCGFGSKSAFNRTYKREMGVSPSQFVKKQQIV